MNLPTGKSNNVVISESSITSMKVESSTPKTFKTLKQLEVEHIKLALERYPSKALASRALGICVKTLYNKLHDYGLYNQYEDPTLRGKNKRIGK